MNISNLTSYNTNMSKSMYDKAFFVDKVDATLFVDFGCADGALIEFMRFLMPECTCMGYDIDKEMLRLANERVSDCIFTDSWANVHFEVKDNKEKRIEVCSRTVFCYP